MFDSGEGVTRPRIAILAIVLALVVVVVVAMAFTSQQMSDLRYALPLLSNAMNWLESLSTRFDMDHVAFFTAVSCVFRVLVPRLRWWWIALVVLAMAAGTELMQFWVPGRTPKLLDVRDDVIGGGLGLLIGSGLLWMVWMARCVVQLLRQHVCHFASKTPADE